MTSLCDQLRESDEQIVLDLLKFHPFLSPASRSVSGLTATRGEILICALGNHVPNMLSKQWRDILAQREIPVVEAEILGDVLKKIDKLELQGPSR